MCVGFCPPRDFPGHVAGRVPGGHPGLGVRRTEQFRGPRRPDRGDAPRSRRPAPVDQRAAVPERPQLLHDPARPGGPAVGDLHRLAHARGAGRSGRRSAVRAARLRRDDGAVGGVRRLWAGRLGRRAVVRAAGGGGGHRAPSGHPGRFPDPAFPRAGGTRDRRVRGAVLLRGALPSGDRGGSGPRMGFGSPRLDARAPIVGGSRRRLQAAPAT